MSETEVQIIVKSKGKMKISTFRHVVGLDSTVEQSSMGYDTTFYTYGSVLPQQVAMPSRMNYTLNLELETDEERRYCFEEIHDL